MPSRQGCCPPPQLWNRTPWRDALVPSKQGLLPGGQSPSPAQPSQDPACPLSSLCLPLSPLTWMAPHQPHLAPGELLLHQEQEASPLLPSRRQTGPCSKSGHTTQNSSAGAVMTLQPRAGCFSRSLESEHDISSPTFSPLKTLPPLGTSSAAHPGLRGLRPAQRRSSPLVLPAD